MVKHILLDSEPLARGGQAVPRVPYDQVVRQSYFKAMRQSNNLTSRQSDC